MECYHSFIENQCWVIQSHWIAPNNNTLFLISHIFFYIFLLTRKTLVKQSCSSKDEENKNLFLRKYLMYPCCILCCVCVCILPIKTICGSYKVLLSRVGSEPTILIVIQNTCWQFKLLRHPCRGWTMRQFSLKT